MLLPMSRSTPASRRVPADSSIQTADAVYGLLSPLVRHLSRELSMTSMATLGTLNRTGPRRITDLATIAGITQPSVTALVTTLVTGRRRAPQRPGGQARRTGRPHHRGL